MTGLHRFVLASSIPVILITAPQTTSAETISPANNEFLNLNCQDIDRSSFIERICYDEGQEYMLIRLSGRLYHYCHIEPGTFRNFLSAPSMGEFYNAQIKGREVARPYDCKK